MTHHIEEEDRGYVIHDDNGRMIAEITYSPAGEHFVIADHTFVDPSLRGQGVAEQLLDHLVEEMDKAGKKVKALCPYVVRQFNEKPDKYDHINYDKA